MSDEARLLASMQLMDGVAFLHSAKVVHASLQPQHLLVSRTNDLLISNFVDAIVMNVSSHNCSLVFLSQTMNDRVM